MKTPRNSVRGRERSRPILKLIAFGLALTLIAAPANAQTNLPGLNSPEAAPDLVTTDVWSEGSEICYQVLNNSLDSATSFTNGLRVDGIVVATQPVSGLGPLGRWNGCFQYTWTCGSPEDTILVGADIYHVVEELNEDQQPPHRNLELRPDSPHDPRRPGCQQHHHDRRRNILAHGRIKRQPGAV